MLPKKRTATKRRGRHPQKALTDAFRRDVAEAGRYADGNGLYLHVDPSGARRWVQRLVVQGRSRTLRLGGYGLVSLARAREKALVNRRRARAGGDIETPAVRPRPGGRAHLRGGGGQGRRHLQRGVAAGRQDGGPVAGELPQLRLPAPRRHGRRPGDVGRRPPRPGGASATIRTGRRRSRRACRRTSRRSGTTCWTKRGWPVCCRRSSST